MTTPDTIIERVDAYTYELVDLGRNHDKYWRVYVATFRNGTALVLRHWGRNGTNGQHKLEPRFNFVARATQVVDGWRNEKTGKGYMPRFQGVVALDDVLRTRMQLDPSVQVAPVAGPEDTTAYTNPFVAFNTRATNLLASILSSTDLQPEHVTGLQELRTMMAALTEQYQEAQDVLALLGDRVDVSLQAV